MKRKFLILVAIGMAIVIGLASMTQEKNVEATNTTSNPSQPLFVDANDQILVWNAQAPAPQQHAADNVGSLAFVDGTGQLSELAPALVQSSRVEGCGPNALSPDGRSFALYMGTPGGVVSSLYLMTDGGEPVLVSNRFNYLGCVGSNGILGFSGDSSQMVFIDYERASQVDFADGILRIVSTADLSELLSANDVVGFDQNEDGIAFVSFFTNDRSEADEAAVTWWNGDVDREITAFLAEEGCRYLNAHIEIAPDGMLWLALATRCSGQSTLDMYRINPEDRSEELMFSVESGGGFAPFAQTNNIYFSSNGEIVLFTVPDGYSNNTTSLQAYEIASGSTSLVIRELVTQPAVEVGASASSVLSPNRRWLAIVVTSVNQRENTLRLIDLDAPFDSQVEVSAGGGGDVISYMGFTSDSEYLVYVAGGGGGRDNSVSRLNLETGESERIRRGTFSQWATLSPSGNEIAILEYQVQLEGIRGPDYLNLLTIDLNSAEPTTLLEGGRVDGDQVVDVQFAAPILWIRR